MKTKYIKIRRRGEEKTWTFELVNEGGFWVSIAKGMAIPIWSDYKQRPWDFELVEMWDEDDCYTQIHRYNANGTIDKCSTDCRYDKRIAEQPKESARDAIKLIRNVLVELSQIEHASAQILAKLGVNESYKKCQDLMDREDKLDEAREIVDNLHDKCNLKPISGETERLKREIFVCAQLNKLKELLDG